MFVCGLFEIEWPEHNSLGACQTNHNWEILYSDILNPTEEKASVIVIKLMESSDSKGVLVQLDFTGN